MSSRQSEERVIRILQQNPTAWLWVGENIAFWRVVDRLLARGVVEYALPGKADYVRLP